MPAPLTGTAVDRPAFQGFRPALELVLALPLVPALLLVLVGFGLPVYVAVAIPAQLGAGALLVPEVWSGARRLQGIGLVAVASAAFWLGLLVVARAVGDPGPAAVALDVVVAVAVYVALSSVALRTLRRALVAWPLAVAAAYGVLLGIAALARPAAEAPLRAGPLLPASTRLVGGTGWEAGSAVAALPGRLAVGSPSPGYGPGFVSVVDDTGQRTPLASRQAGRSGLRLVGQPGDTAGYAVADSGADLLVGAPSAGSRHGASGAAYLVHVGRRRGVVRLDDIAHGRGPGYRLDGAFPGDSAGYAVASAGDVNADGRPDLAVAAPRFGPSGAPSGVGAVYVVWGRAAGSRDTVDLQTIGTGPPRQGYRIVSRAGATAGLSVAAAGDVNGDGVPDLLVGAADASPRQRAGAGEAWVVFGQRRWSTIDLAALGTPRNAQGLQILGAEPGDAAGTALTSLGDVNGDGRTDVAVGAPHASPAGRRDAGAAYVVYGRGGGSVDLRDLGRASSAGFSVDGAIGGRCETGIACGDEAGTALASAAPGGRPTLLVGAPAASATGSWAGAVFAVPLRRPAHGDRIDLRHVGRRVEGADPNGRAGAAMAPIVHGGRLGALVGAPAARSDNGAAYVIDGFGPST